MPPHRGYLPITDIAAIYRISPRTARRWAAADKWRRRATAPEYSITDADRSAQARRTSDGRQKRGPYRKRQPEPAPRDTPRRAGLWLY
jgi:uncharacterized protein YjcR